MEIQCLFEDYTFNTGETYYKCIINYPSYLSEDNLTYFGTHKPGRSNNDVTFIEIRYNNIRKDLLKSFPNIKILSVQVSNFKTISKDELIEFKNIERFICEYCELEYLPRDLFEGFSNLKYIKMIRNKLTIIEPNILDGLDKLEYVNFKSNPNYSKFYSKNPIYVSDSTLEELKNHLFEVFLTFDKNVIEKYIESYPDKIEILRIFRERSNDVNSNLKMHELTFSYYDEKRIQENDEYKQFSTQLEQKIMKLEQINIKLNEKIIHFKELEAKSKQQIDELIIEISNEKNDKKRLKRDLQKQIDVLAQQLQSVLLINVNK